MLTEHGVTAAYQLLLGRLPESEEIVRRFVEQESFDLLRDAILGSEEFAGRIADRPELFDVHPWVAAGCRSTRLACRQLEHLASLELAMWGRVALCCGDESGLHASFFMDRLCKVVVPARDRQSVTALRDRLRRSHQAESADRLEVRLIDLWGSVIRSALDACPVVTCHEALPPPKEAARFISNLSRLCTEMLLLDVPVGFGAGESIVATNETVRGRAAPIAIPTRHWVWVRLAQEFAHVYVPRTQPCHEDYTPSWRDSHRGQLSSRAVFIASRTPLDEARLSPGLVDIQPAYPVETGSKR